ncbi:putative baseplate assembly protein [Saccharopolyspora phatthalungensis]|uniref:Putative phage baseplate assembly protein n=1 Tax=Saccharopolyspora phatthalungensis TaxID=664693 RepID=A0A840Q8I1_9PSEU|nr:putative baseplate assembly protein [Saccharopolyspora phatthalungensis]MBB5157044.1 putative phage baseplate assembly protein [Saccharopolyspora phatthalungensis]
MTLDFPNLDTRTYDDLVAEARRRIVRFVPEWTDFNASDPGTALVELFCWLTETLLYETNRMPDLAYVKFLELVGFSQHPAVPAAVDLTFVPMAQVPDARVPSGTQASAIGADGSPVVFETDEDLALVSYPLTHIGVAHQGQYSPVLQPLMDPPPTYRPFGCRPKRGDALYLGFAPLGPAADDTPAPPARFPELLRLRVTVPPEAGLLQSLSAAEADELPDPPVQLAWEYQTHRGSDTSLEWRPVSVLSDTTGRLTHDGYLVIAGPQDVPLTSVREVDGERYWLRCRLAKGAYAEELEPLVEAVSLNTVSARNLDTEHEELLGHSEGHPSETYQLRQTPVDPTSVVLETRADAGPTRRWNAKADLLSSGPADPDFTLEPTTGVVTFGDGRRGLIPPANAEIVAASYRHGGGVAGNVPAGAVMTLLAELPGVDHVTNHRPATAGADRQSLAELKTYAKAMLRSQRRAVTAEDYASFARQVPGVADAIARPLVHPDHPGEQVPGVVTVVIAARREAYGPRVDPVLLAKVCRSLERVRVLATELHVSQPELVEFTITITLRRLPPDRTEDQVRQDVIKAVKRFMDPFAPGPGAMFRTELRFADLWRELLSVTGFQEVTDIEIDVQPAPTETPNQQTYTVRLKPGQLAVLKPDGVTVTFTKGEDR